MPNESTSRRANGWITPAVFAVVRGASRVPELYYGSREEAQRRQGDRDFTRARARKVDNFVAFSTGADIVAFACVSTFRETYVCLALLGMLVATTSLAITLAVAVRIALFDASSNPPDLPSAVASPERIVVLGFINYLQLIVCFAAIYAWAPKMLGRCPGQVDWIDPLYLSAVSQLTIGYGDLSPSG